MESMCVTVHPATERSWAGQRHGVSCTNTMAQDRLEKEVEKCGGGLDYGIIVSWGGAASEFYYRGQIQGGQTEQAKTGKNVVESRDRSEECAYRQCRASHCMSSRLTVDSDYIACKLSALVSWALKKISTITLR